MKTTSQLREAFISYFEKKEHRRVPSHSLIPPADPTLLFVNAGMVQFKDIFVGQKTVDYTRATSSQKCLRVSGKHNDLENVGRTARHHTFFEMLGNFSFGNYFKREAIEFAYEFLIHTVGLDASRMYYTVFGGDPSDGIGSDKEAIQHWIDVAGVGPERVLEFGKKDNFWAMGETGPCGPCSEILFDRGPGSWACGEDSCAPGCDCDRYVEIWNLVFMQFERKVAGGPLLPLPAPSIDTGMGLERLACIVQGKATNYETDAFMPIIRHTGKLLEEVLGKALPYGVDAENDVAYHVIADHARAAAFLVADGVYPDNEGRGYISRLLMRRAVRFGRKLGFKAPFFYQVCDRVVGLMCDAYPDLEAKRQLIGKVVMAEEESFSRTFDDGRRALEAEMDRLSGNQQKKLGGEILFWLHDERGFQPDLVEVIAAEQGFTVDRQGYQQLMDVKRATSGKVASSSSGAAGNISQLDKLAGKVEFTGYESLQEQSHILAILVDGRDVSALSEGDEGLLVMDRTPFYAESGGQVGDTGTVVGPSGAADVTNTTRYAADVTLHHVRVSKGCLNVGATVDVRVDARRRTGIRAHHSGTHLLHWALAEVLGEHIKQEGSQVRPDMLRFDFRHFSPLTLDDIEQIEKKVARLVVGNSAVETRVTGMEDAMASGAKAFFDEKYGEQVRLVSMGEGASRELCGGIHVGQTGEVGPLKVTKQEAVSSGVRRIYAVCHDAATDYLLERERKLENLAAVLNTSVDTLDSRVDKLLQRNDDLEKQVKQLKRKLLEGGAGGPDTEMFEVNGIGAAYAFIPEGEVSAMRSMSDMLRDRLKEGVVLVGAVSKGRLMFVVAATKDHPSGFHCGKAVSQLAKVVNGRGGGKADFGQGGGEPERWTEAVQLFRDLLERHGS